MATKDPKAAPLIGTPVAGTPPCPTGLPRRLVGTSQGRRDDIPPEDWIQEELIRYQVVGRCNYFSRLCFIILGPVLECSERRNDVLLKIVGAL